MERRVQHLATCTKLDQARLWPKPPPEPHPLFRRGLRGFGFGFDGLTRTQKKPPPAKLAQNDSRMAAPAVKSPLSQSVRTQHSEDGDSSADEEETTATTSKLANLAIEEVEIDVEGLNPLSPEVISKQATINIGTSSLRFRVWRLRRREVKREGRKTKTPAGQGL